MRGNHTNWSGLLLVLTAGVLAACAQMQQPPVVDKSPVPYKQATEMFLAGYTHIAEKYIEKIPASQMAMEGIRGLGSIDPALTVKRVDDKIFLPTSDPEEEPNYFDAPADNDIKGWADLTVKIWSEGRKASPELFNSSPEKLYEAVFDGALSKLDIYSRYSGLKEATRNRARREGFGGIGIRFKVSSKSVRITRIIKKTPAARSGLLVGDLILRVGSIPVVGLSSRDVSDQLRGRIDSKVKLTISRGSEPTPRIFLLERHLIVAPTVKAKINDGIVFMKISGFNQQTSRDLAKKMQHLRNVHGHKIRGVVLDLRGNPGGLLNQAIKIADLFLDHGKIVSTRGRHPESIQYYEAGGRDIARGLPLILLMDGRSASSSEVLAAALQDQGRAVIIGTTSFGKGTVQTVIRMPNNGEITLTWSRLYSPAGYVLHGLGLRPSFCTSGSGEMKNKDLFASIADEKLVRQAFKSWRNTGIYKQAQRSKLRASCPAERRKKAVEVRAARNLLNNVELYARALALAAFDAKKPVEEAIKAPKQNITNAPQ
ncbi:MAG: S41 family peptidase [Rhodospirillales bacterium]|nr:S41 family peptidase [Rhodospirillaceae bacterium]MBT7486459.1 S41 family peptidase [Rhodospirillales bacterium]MBT5033080.1 S41 family peptidase [Rhodospirillaceae bacterium]MBT6221723.1 S41 family peptidase [Rhodospirillaceae bacterium]MBT6362394.1 S41 family peptidase [Rhodospirillaceae bacterium]